MLCSLSGIVTAKGFAKDIGSSLEIHTVLGEVGARFGRIPLKFKQK